MIEFWADKSKNELDECASSVLLPIGSTEQHGSHLPVGTDSLLAEAVVKALADRYRKELDLSVLPLLSYGKSTEHSGFPGTITLSARTLLGLIEDIAFSLKSQGIRTFIILNAHGGNVGILESAMYDIRQQHGLKTYVISMGKLFDALGGDCSFPKSMHAGFAETSVMKYIYPEYGNLYEKTPGGMTPGEDYSHFANISGTVAQGWITEDLSGHEGYMGDPSESSAEAGKEILTRLVDMLYRHLSILC